MIYKIILFTSLTFLAALNTNASDSKHKIAVLVNEEMITSYDIVQRMKINAILNKIDISKENNQLIANSAVDELIQEILKSEKINEYDIGVDDNEYNENESNFFKNTGLNKNYLIENFKINNINYEEFENYLKQQMAWQKLVGYLFYRLASASQTEIDDMVSKNPNMSIEQAENLVIQRQLDLQSSKLLRDMLNEATIEYK